ncbi:MAG: O-acetyl-ADP-ribose deacetylase [Anaerolineae bacterium]|nr:O-acetyl-ADP-ribose deacetylase [Anaerolineae bacterium]
MSESLPLKARINHAILELIEGDITKQDTDAIVNAANSSLLGGGGVDGAIHRAAGPELLEETRALGGCQTGDAKITRGYHLKARHVIHTVGPIYGGSDSARLLASAYRRSLEVAQENNIRTIAFPSLSTGAYGYPVDQAAPIALETVCRFLQGDHNIQLVRFVLFNSAILQQFSKALAHQIQQQPGIVLPA